MGDMEDMVNDRCNDEWESLDEGTKMDIDMERKLDHEKAHERALAKPDTQPLAIAPEIAEKLALAGDLSGLTPPQKVAYYGYRCQMLGLDPMGRPFDYLQLNGKLVLYANKGCTEQLTESRKLSSQIVSRELMEGGLFAVGVRVTGADGRCTENMAVVPLGSTALEARANMMMKCATKALRRTVLSHCGLGMLDETEVDTIPGARRVGELEHAPIKPVVPMKQARAVDAAAQPVVELPSTPPATAPAAPPPAKNGQIETASVNFKSHTPSTGVGKPWKFIAEDGTFYTLSDSLAAEIRALAKENKPIPLNYRYGTHGREILSLCIGDLPPVGEAPLDKSELQDAYDAAEGDEHIVLLVKETKKSGTTAKGPWTRFAFVGADKVWYSTFSSTCAERLRAAMTEERAATFKAVAKDFKGTTSYDITGVRP